MKRGEAKNMNAASIADGLEQLLTALSDDHAVPCTRKKMMPHADGSGRTPVERLESCTRQHEDEFDNDGRPLFFYGDGCKLVEGFCPSCRAYWHVAVARNAMFDHARLQAAIKQDAIEEAAKRAAKGGGA